MAGLRVALLALPLVACSTQTTHVQAKTPPKSILVIGDSFSAATPGLTMWPELLKNKLNVTVEDRAVPGAGYVAPGIGPRPERFVHQLAERPATPDIVIIFGSTNDQPASATDIHTSAVDTLTVARALYPKAKLIVSGPQTAAVDSEPTQSLYTDRDAVITAAQEVGLAPEDMTNLFTGYTDTVGPDKFHPNQAGQQVIADHFIGVIGTL